MRFGQVEPLWFTVKIGWFDGGRPYTRYSMVYAKSRTDLEDKIRRRFPDRPYVGYTITGIAKRR